MLLSLIQVNYHYIPTFSDVEKLVTLRKEMYDTHLKAKMERCSIFIFSNSIFLSVPQEDSSDDEIVFSDEED
jgi:hypothetical protein